MRIDAHQHFWKFDPIRDSWITPEMAVIQRDFMPEHLEPLLKKNGIDGTVAVQASQTESETDFLIGLSEKHSFIKGIVGWVDLRSESVRERLAHYSKFPVVKGFRHVLQGEQQRDMMLSSSFLNGIAALKEFGYTYDILIFPDQIRFSADLAGRFPQQRFVIDHLAKPYIKRGEIDAWRTDIMEIAAHPNVYCKISGMVTEADWHHWKKDDFSRYMDVVTEAFGAERIMFGSDWPVCQVAASYAEVVEIVSEYYSTFPSHVPEQVFSGNAIDFYNLEK